MHHFHRRPHPRAERRQEWFDSIQGITDIIVISISNGVRGAVMVPSALTSAPPPSASTTNCSRRGVVSRLLRQNWSLKFTICDISDHACVTISTVFGTNLPAVASQSRASPRDVLNED